MTKAYEEIEFSPELTLRWIREGNQYVCRATEEQLQTFKQKALINWVTDAIHEMRADNQNILSPAEYRRLLNCPWHDNSVYKAM